ncbi:MAG: hypothetical protein AAF709_13405 [Pseudomonadota bacterium]
MNVPSKISRMENERESREDDYDIAAAHLAARAMQNRVLWVCSVLGLAGLVILAVCLAQSNPHAAQRGVPGLTTTQQSS